MQDKIADEDSLKARYPTVVAENQYFLLRTGQGLPLIKQVVCRTSGIGIAEQELAQLRSELEGMGFALYHTGASAVVYHRDAENPEDREKAHSLNRRQGVKPLFQSDITRSWPAIAQPIRVRR